jgi:hypothetical protein
MTKEAENTTLSKTQELIEAARLRNKAEQEVAETPKNPVTKNNLSDEEVEVMREGAEKRAAVKVQAKAGSLTGVIDVDAMGDVKGDGGDAKDYADNDPAKALGVPVYQHGLGATKDGVDEYAGSETVYGHRTSARTNAELERGREALAGVKASRAAARAVPSRTVVTDVDDTDGSKAAEALKNAKK